MQGKWKVYQKKYMIIYFSLRQKKFVVHPFCNISENFKKITIFAKNRLFPPAKLASLKNCCMTCTQQKNIWNQTSWVYLKIYNIINIVYQQEHKKFWAFCRVGGGCHKSLKNSQKQRKTAKSSRHFCDILKQRV